MKLVVGLGNPGRKYEETRHNIGWSVLAELARRFGDSRPKSNFQGEVVDASLGGERALFLAPHTFMNHSGRSVLAARDFYKIETKDILVVCDDFHLPLAKLRMRSGGSAGGQNGLADVIRVLGTQEVARLRIGVGEPPGQWNAADYVLSKFAKSERTEIELAVVIAGDAVVAWASDGADACMNRFN